MPCRRFLVHLLTVAAGLLVAAGPTLASPLAIHGRIVDAHDAPAAGVPVALVPAVDRYASALDELAGRFEPEAALETTSDGQGRFTLTAPAAGLWRVWIDAEGSVPLEARPEVLVEEIELPTAKLVPAIDTEVRVHGEGGRPLAEARVSVSSRGRGRDQRRGLWRPRHWRGLTGADGKAQIPGVRDNDLVIDVCHPVHLPARLERVHKSAVTVNLVPGWPQPIEIRDPAGRPAPGVVARVGKGLCAAGVSDAEGRLMLIAPRLVTVPAGASAGASNVGEDRLAFELLSRDFQVRRSHLQSMVGKSPKPLRFDLSPAISITGQVIDEATREPLARAVVWSSGRQEALVSSDVDGSFRLSSPVAGSVAVMAAARGYLRSASEATAEEGREVLSTTVTLEPSSSLFGGVVDERGNPLAGVEIDAIARPGPIRFGRRWANFVRHHAVSDASGRFRIRSLMPKLPYELAANKRGYADRRQSFVSPPQRQTTKVEVVLLRGRVGVGLVVDVQDKPIAGAEVTLERRDEGDAWNLWTTSLLGGGPDHRANSDLGGSYEISDLAAGRYRLRVYRSGYAVTTVPGVEVPAGAGDVDLGTVTLNAGADIMGKVIDALGMPLAGAEILGTSRDDGFDFSQRHIQPARALSGVDGSFLITDCRPGAEVDLTASATGYLNAELSGVEAPNQEPVVLTLQPVTHISGRVTDGDGGPIAGAYVAFRMKIPRSHFSKDSSDDRGRFYIADAAPGSGSLEVYAKGWQNSRPLALEVPSNGIDDLEITLRRGAAVVFGTVSDTVDSPVADARISVAVRAGAERISVEARTGGDGSFRVGGLDPGKGILTVDHLEHPRLSRDLEVEAGENRIELRLSSGVEVSGQVVNDQGRPVVGAIVHLVGQHKTREWRQATTDDEGAFELIGLADGIYNLRVKHPEYASASMADEVTVAGQPVHGLVLRLGTGTVITGRLLGLEFDELSSLVIMATSERNYLQGEVDFEARYRISRATPGRWRVKVASASGRMGQGVVTIGPGELETTLDVELGLGQTLRGQVLAGDQPVPGVDVELIGTDVAVSAGGRSDYQGNYEIAGLEAGHYRLMTNLPGSAMSLYRQLRITGDETLDLVFETGRVAGRVVDATGHTPIAGVRLSVEPSWEDDANAVTSMRRPRENSDASGGFDLGELAAGSWQLSATKDGFAPVETPLSVVAGQDLVDLELAMRPTEGLWLTVSQHLGSGLKDVRAAVIDRQGRSVAFGRYPIEAEGRVHLASVPAGSWELVVGASGVATVSLPVTAPSDQPQIDLERGSGLSISVPELSEDKVMARAELQRPDGRSFRHLSWSDVRSSFPLRFGEAVIQDLGAGIWNLTVTTADERSWSASVTVVPGTIESVRLE